MNDRMHNEWPPADVVDTPFAQLATQPFTLFVQSCARLQAESIRFAARRAKKDLLLPQRLAACATPAESFGACASFWFDATRDYLRESQRLFALAAGDFENSAAAVV